MTEQNSPNYRLGLEHGMRDTVLESSCPPGMAIGPEPPDPAYPVMYRRGYDKAYNPQPCACDGSCKRENRTEKGEDAA